MRSRLNAYKNVGWAIAIGLCLMAVLVGLVYAAFTRYGGELERGGVQLGAAKTASSGAASTVQENPAAPAQSSTGELITVETGADAGQAYIDSLTFLCDSSLIGLRDYGLLTDGSATTQVWGSSAGNIPASTIATCTVRFPNDGSEIPAASAAMVAKPAKLIITLSSDGLSGVDRESFIADYTKLIQDIQKQSPQTVIACTSLSPVTATYVGSDGLTMGMISNANDWIKQVCIDTGVYYLDTASAVKDGSGALDSQYASANGKTLNSAGLNRILEYLRTHAI